MAKHLDVNIYGQVQGVGFRFAVEKVASGLGICGFVKNLGDGVYLEAEGEEQQLKEFLKWCQQGPIWSKVAKVETQEGQVKNYQSFSIAD